MTKLDALDAAARGEGCLGRSAADEPVFVLVARDRTASAAVRAWAASARAAALAAGEPLREEKYAEALAVAGEMDAWRAANGGGKLPD